MGHLLLHDEVVQTGTPSSVEPCEAGSFHTTQDKESNTTNDREPPRSSVVTGSAATPDHE